MAKVGSNTKYRWRFGLPQSDYQFELVMYPSELGTIANTFVDCDEVAITEFKFNWEFDKYPIGILNPTIDITFNLNLCTSDLQYLLINPYYDVTFQTNDETSFQTSTGLSLNSHSISFGNYYELSIKHVDDISYTLVFQGVTSDVDSSGITNNTRKVTIESLGKTILSNIDIDWASMVWLDSSLGSAPSNLSCYSYSVGSNTELIEYSNSLANTGTYTGWLFAVNDIMTYWQEIINIVCTFMTRGVRTSYTIDFFSKFITSLYKRSTTNNAAISGVALTSTELKVCTHIGKGNIVGITWTQEILDSVIDNTVGGLFYLMKNSQYNTLWDFASMYCQSSLFKYNNCTSIAPYTAGNATTFDIEMISYNMEAETNYEVLKEVSSQYLEESGENAKEFKQKNNANKTDNSYTLEHIFSTKIYVPDEKTITGSTFSGGLGRRTSTSQIPNSMLLYSTNKVHENYNPDLGNSKDLNDYASVNSYTLPSNVNELNLAGYQAIESGLSNNASLTAKCLLELFKSKTQTKLKFDMLFDDTIISGVNSIIFQPNLRDIYFDMTNFNTHYSEYSNNHILTKCEFDVLSGLTTFETISRSW